MRSCLLLLCAFMFACATQPHLSLQEVVEASVLPPHRDKFATTNLGPTNPKELLTWNAAFDKWASKYHLILNMQKIEVRFGDIDCPKDKMNGDYCVVAYCREQMPFSQIVVDRKTWNESDAYDKEQVYFHEMGHCMLHRDHKDNKDKDGNYTSVMHFSMIPSDMYKKRRLDYMKELFTETNSPTDVHDPGDKPDCIKP